MAEVAETPAVTTPETGGLKLLLEIFTSPSAVGQAVARKTPWPAILVALALISAVLLGGTFLFQDILIEESIVMMRAQMAKSPGAAAGAEQAEAMMRRPGMRLVMVGGQVVFAAISIPLIALVLYLGQLVMGGQAGFGATFGVTALSCLISYGLGWTTRTALVLARGSFLDVSTGLGMFVDAPFNDPLRAVLDFFDLFLVWAVLAAGSALAAPARLSPAAARGVSIAAYLLLGGLGVVLRILR